MGGATTRVSSSADADADALNENEGTQISTPAYSRVHDVFAPLRRKAENSVMFHAPALRLIGMVHENVDTLHLSGCATSPRPRITFTAATPNWLGLVLTYDSRYTKRKAVPGCASKQAIEAAAAARHEDARGLPGKS